MTPLDYLALAVFALSWAGYTFFADSSRWRVRSMSDAMNAYRRRWMSEMLRRENRVVDINILGNLSNGAAFFASTAILAVGGLSAAFGASEEAISVLEGLPFALATSEATWQVKVLFLIVIMIYGFFKFAWAFRLLNHCSVLVGAAPRDWENDPEAEVVAARAARINALAARHFKRGLRAYFFALATLAWLVHPGLFTVTAPLVVGVLYRREFRSRSLRALRDQA